MRVSALWLVPALPGCFGSSQGPTWHRVRGAPSVVHSGFTGSQSQRLPAGSAVANTGLLGAGMAVIAGMPYQGSIYVRVADPNSTDSAGRNPRRSDVATPPQLVLSLSIAVEGVPVAVTRIQPTWPPVRRFCSCCSCAHGRRDPPGCHHTIRAIHTIQNLHRTNRAMYAMLH